MHPTKHPRSHSSTLARNEPRKLLRTVRGGGGGGRSLAKDFAFCIWHFTFGISHITFPIPFTIYHFSPTPPRTRTRILHLSSCSWQAIFDIRLSWRKQTNLQAGEKEKFIIFRAFLIKCQKAMRRTRTRSASEKHMQTKVRKKRKS